MFSLQRFNRIGGNFNSIYKGTFQGKDVFAKYGRYCRKHDSVNEYKMSLLASELVNTPKPLLHVQYSDPQEVDDELINSVLVFEWCEGETIQNHLDEGFPLDKKDVINQMLDIVETLHEDSIFHRNLYPPNWMICEGKVTVINFSGASGERFYEEIDNGDLAATITSILCNREENTIVTHDMTIKQMREAITLHEF